MAESSKKDIVAIEGNRNTEFYNKIVNKLAVATVSINDKVEANELKRTASKSLSAIDKENGTRLMLSAQMAAVHDLQQRLTAYAYNISQGKEQMYYVNSVVKLSNIFVQQVNMLEKLKGNGQNKVVVEHVHVHSGGQAVVGTISPCAEEKTKK